MPSTRVRKVYRTDDVVDLKDEEKEQLLESYLPDGPPQDARRQWRDDDIPPKGRFGLRRALRSKVHLAIYTVLHAIFSLYIRIRQAWHLVCYHISSIMFYHHRTPESIERDVVGLKKKPKHLSVILKREPSGRHGAELERLVAEAAEIAVWCVCAKIPVLTVYERTGLLKHYLPHLQQSIIQKSRSYFGRHQPALTVAMPHADDVLESPAHGDFARNDPRHLKVLFISAEDGRASMVDLTRTLTEMSQKGKLHPRDISTDLIDAELSEGIMPEPDLLISFGPYVDLDGYPPWPIRLTEIFCLPDNQGVGYQVFLRALLNFSSAQFRKGK
ncbi:Di-trans,poly-cis-decaprenylcistransferase [Colletotrichum abscissum]|uniref:ditrans,polycis-polyprenyl diphosphate synthase [(2E,6E)-farnesyldiphosphate specific] n=1 Tax=Colletotrichum abscissum TaxID=1671311 RepID=A0A9P9X8U6_9PEZI|nr:Di-trans,poly-cis-decaprenylcistransferase [Colletotrichum abscissum]KAI3542679.1 Di-trans,poly-cis-decaprenylcistransferase [Colletotrichum abscissum]KAK1473487.1 Di-trans,poly-cis-decaprenylcistransferase [Colletotrichum abscissum]